MIHTTQPDTMSSGEQPSEDEGRGIELDAKYGDSSVCLQLIRHLFLIDSCYHSFKFYYHNFNIFISYIFFFNI